MTVSAFLECSIILYLLINCNCIDICDWQVAFETMLFRWGMHYKTVYTTQKTPFKSDIYYVNDHNYAEEERALMLCLGEKSYLEYQIFVGVAMES